MSPTTIYLVRHAQSDFQWKDDETRPLTHEAEGDLQEVVRFFSSIPIDHFSSSPYRRAVDTIAPVAAMKAMSITTDPRLRERRVGTEGQSAENLRRRWSDFDFHEPEGESLAQVQRRNTEALDELLTNHQGQTIVVGTHGTALSTILKRYRADFGLEDFLKLIDLMPYIVALRFQGHELVSLEEKLAIQKPYTGPNNLKTAASTSSSATAV